MLRSGGHGPTGACGHLMAARPCWAGSQLLALLLLLKGSTGTPRGPVVETLHSHTVGPGLTPDWGTTSHMPQLKVRKTERKKEEKEERNGSAARPTGPAQQAPVCRHFLHKQAQKPPGGMTPGFSGRPKKLLSHK